MHLAKLCALVISSFFKCVWSFVLFACLVFEGDFYSLELWFGFVWGFLVGVILWRFWVCFLVGWLFFGFF